MFQLILIAARNLAQHRRRTLLLAGAIAGVTALLVVMLGVTNGVRQTMFRSATTLMTGHINVGGFYKVTSGQAAPVVTQWEKIASIVRKNTPELDYLTQRGRGWAKLISDTSSIQVGVGGIDIKSEPGFREVIRVKSGKLEDLAQPNTVLIFAEQAKKLGVAVGDTMTLSAPTMRGVSNTVDLRVVAIAQDVGLLSGFNIYIPDTALRALYTLNDTSTGALHLYLKDTRTETLKAVQERLRKALTDAGYTLMDPNPVVFFMKFEAVTREDWTGQRLDLTNWEEEISFMKFSLTALEALTGSLTFVLLIIISIGIMNTLWIAIRERTREIGTLRAVGMQRRRVLLMFLIEAIVLSVTATLGGAVLGVGVAALLNALQIALPLSVQMFLLADTLHVEVQGLSVLNAALLITVCASLISLIPSYLAARMKPITAMHHVG